MRFRDIRIVYVTSRMQFDIDMREGALIEELSDAVDKDTQINVRQLDMGDILLRAPGAGEWVFERKTLADLAASIKDGRYREQKARLLAHYHPSRITYILEGAPNVSTWCARDASTSTVGVGRISTSTFQGFVFNTMYRDGIHIMFTHDVEDTASLLIAFATKVAKTPDAFHNSASGVPACTQENAMMVKSRPGANVTPELCWRLMLSQIPGVSSKLSKEIVALWPSMTLFIHDLGPLEDKERVAKLKAVPLLGPKKAATICTYVFA